MNRQSLSNFIYNVLYKILVLFIPLVTTPYLSRIIGAEGIGTYTYHYSIAYYFVLFAKLGLGEYGNRAVAVVRDNKQQLSQVFWSIYAFQGLMALACIAGYLLLFAHGENKMALIMGVYVISGLFDINWFFFGMEKFKITVTRNMVIKLIATAMIFLFVKTETDLYKYGLIMAGATLLSQMVLWPYLYGVISFYRPSLRDIAVHIKPNLVLFIPAVSVSFYRVLDKVMLGMMSDNIHVGYYESVESINNVPVSIVRALGAVMYPQMTNLVATGQAEKVRKSIGSSLYFVMFLATSISFGLLSIVKEFVPAFFGAGFEPCIALFSILLPSCLFIAYADVIRTQYLMPFFRDKVFIWSVVAGAVCNVGLNLMLIPRLQSTGAAISTLCAEFVVCFLQIWPIRKELPVRYYTKNCIPFLTAGVLMFLLIRNISAGDGGWITIGIKIAAGVVAYFAALLAQILLLKRLGKMELYELLVGLLKRRK